MEGTRGVMEEVEEEGLALLGPARCSSLQRFPPFPPSPLPPPPSSSPLHTAAGLAWRQAFSLSSLECEPPLSEPWPLSSQMWKEASLSVATRDIFLSNELKAQGYEAEKGEDEEEEEGRQMDSTRDRAREDGKTDEIENQRIEERNIAPRGTSLVAVEDEIFCGIVRDMQVDDPVHEIETDETNREHDPRVFVDVRRRARQQNLTYSCSRSLPYTHIQIHKSHQQRRNRLDEQSKPQKTGRRGLPRVGPTRSFLHALFLCNLPVIPTRLAVKTQEKDKVLEIQGYYVYFLISS
ncbi:hypothetical protein E2C01_015613 [Portunus trituberculatus]|uniref:Uncharacterized protein n=1 Tax=Portunus trituberculatus TaxID=210409 RepID=A0A5B7DN34_PORTR|nr:hypothetical protein [Portunus trituberculatus]